MDGKRILLFPNTNTLSHLAQAFAIAQWLEAEGWQCHIGCARSRLAWASRFYSRCHEVNELWEHSGVPFPCIGWFSNPSRIEHCLRSQEELIRAVRPSAVIGIFDFLSKASARGLPLISINGFCVLPVYDGVLGFDECDCLPRRQQQRVLERFWRFAARAINHALHQRGLAPVAKAADMLPGDVNLIYEVAEVCDAPNLPSGYHLTGPIFWDGWDKIGEPPPRNADNKRPTVLLNSGSLPLPEPALLHRLIRHLLDLGARVWVNSGWGGPSEDCDRLFCRPFLAPSEAVPRADLVVCRGGVGACYQNLYHEVPSLVLPTQPEQAANGIQLQKHGCGRVIAPRLVFTGGPTEYPSAIEETAVMALLHEMLPSLDAYRPHLQRIGRAVRTSDARSFICKLMGTLA